MGALLYLGIFRWYQERPGTVRDAVDVSIASLMRQSSDLGTAGLQRGRKFLLLVTIFGTNVLHAVPEVSVRRLDLVSLEELKKLATGSVETVRVKRILGRMAS